MAQVNTMSAHAPEISGPGELQPALDGAILAENAAGVIVSWSAAAELLWGYRSGEMIGKRLDPILLERDRERRAQAVDEALTSGQPRECVCLCFSKDNKRLWTHWRISLVRGEPDGPWVVSEILSWEPASPPRSALEDAETWGAAVVQSAVDAIITIDSSGTIQYVNRAAERMFGFTAEEARGRNISIIMPSPYAEEHDAYLRAYLKTGDAKIIGIGREIVAKRMDGTVFPIELSVSEVRIGGQRLFTGIIHDTTQRMLMQEEKDRLLRDLNKRNSEILCMAKARELLHSQRDLGEIFDQVCALVPEAMTYPGQARCAILFDTETHATHPLEPASWRVSADIRVSGRRRGELTVWYDPDLALDEEGAFIDEERELITNLAEALSETAERHEAEAKVLQASKLASVGELAAGVGHEINNPLNGIMNCADILLKGAAPDSKEYKYLTLIQSESERIANIVRSLLTFSRQERERHSPARLCDIIEGVLSLCRKKIQRSHIELIVDVPEDLPKINCRSAQLQQVAMNLIINAMHALDERFPTQDPEKKLIIRARMLDGTAAPFVRLTFEDYGCGIPRANMERLFDPFFTTKGRDKGTGLGLSVSDGIVKAHGGSISVESAVNRYTRFHVDLPLNAEWQESVR